MNTASDGPATMRASILPHRAMRLAAALAAAATLVLPAETGVVAAATHHPTSGRRSHHAGRRACKRRSCKSHARKHAAHRHAGATHKATASSELVAATCEDGTLPSNAGGGAYSCGDGSAPACEAGKLVAGTATSQPLCSVKPAEKEEGKAVEYTCEDASEATGQQGCETSTEQEALESEEE